ncbi:MAG: 50S ribosomal protein L10 [Anaerolineae bacterium]|nr:50S ribosomal protein L10 [Anaerolineae bacterium]
MAITRERKEELVAQYAELLQHATGFIVTEYRGMTMGDFNALRGKLRETGGAYVVTKNTLFSIALREADWPVPEEMLLGPVATAFADGNLPGLAKTLIDFRKDHEQHFVIKGGVMLGNLLSAADVEAISKLPTLDELRAQLAGLLVQPATGLVSVLNAATSDIVNVLHAYVQENSESGEAA